MAGKTARSDIDRLLAAVLRGDAPGWPAGGDVALAVERILYHGIAGLITERARDLKSWPSDVLSPVRDQAIAQAMWEMRHKPLLADLLADFAQAGITALLLKGSALAYDLYHEPSARSRGDSDVLIAPGDLAKARRVLRRLGFARGSEEAPSDELALQEIWSITGDDGLQHHIDLHWQLLNAPALAGVMPFDACTTNPHALPLLGPDAIAMNRVATLLHTCVHRAMHITNPYFVEGVTYYGGDRLIWAKDIDLLASALSDTEWDSFGAEAIRQGVAVVALNGLNVASTTLGTQVPSHVREQLRNAKGEKASAYLLSAGQARRSWRDLLAIPGFRGKIAYALSRTLPSAAFMRGKYPDMAARPLAALHARRMIDLVRRRPERR